MKRLAVVLLMIVLQASAFSQQVPGDPNPDSEIRKQTDRYFDAIDRQDVKMLDDLLVKECLVFYPRGLRDTKASFLKTLGKSKGADEPAQATHTLGDVKVRRVGDTAVVTTLLTTKRGDASEVTNRRTLTWALQDGRWRLLHDEWSLVGDSQSAEYWSDYFRGKDRNFNQKPNSLLVHAVEDTDRARRWTWAWVRGETRSALRSGGGT
ncbi:MAG TPA: hypothetical protein DD670_17515 [Planctomycetaceae bacterium]|nr:hypothetical protein [Planctomycetaceae bacterium]